MTEENQRGEAAPLPLALVRIMDLGRALGVPPMNQHEGCWEHQVDERWRIAANGHRQDRMTSKGEIVKPFTVYIQYNGWPAGLIDAGGGIIAAGEGANEETFIRALELAIGRATLPKDPTPNNREADEYEQAAPALLSAADGRES
jgi:hypothetical protein